MDDFQFIIESPHKEQSQRKRLRLVTSCDNCRLKKIKCLQASPDSKCDTCNQAKVSCHFRDRERYFIERSQTVASPGTTQSSLGIIQSTSAYNSNRLTELPDDERINLLDTDSSLNKFSVFKFKFFSPPSSDEISSPQDPTRPPTKERGHTNSQFALPTFDPVNDDLLSGYFDLGLWPSCSLGSSGISDNALQMTSQQCIPAPLFDTVNDGPLCFDIDLGLWPSYSSGTFGISDNALQITGQHRLLPLFNPSHSQYPHGKLMPHFIQKFAQYLGVLCPFVTYDYTLDRFLNGNLPPLLANSIAALAVEYSDLPELVARGLGNVSWQYNEKAKSLLSTTIHIPSIETLHALILLSWSEYRGGHILPFLTYCEMGLRMALDLGLSTNNAMRLNINERGRTQLRVTWFSIVQLNFFASTYESK